MKYLILFWISILSLKAEPPVQNIGAKKNALLQLNKIDTLNANPLWPNIDPKLFVQNLRANIENPLNVDQGKPTYFCGYAAFTHYLLLVDPEKYAQMHIELYQNGKTQVIDRELTTDSTIRNAAGLLSNKGKMDIHPADQMWFLTLSHNYKGYLNVFNKTFDMGDENNLWAASNLKKFNRIFKSITGRTIHSRGSDLIRPLIGNMNDFIQERNQDNVMFIYLNNKALYPNKFFRFILPTPTHFVILYKLNKEGKYYHIDYWDYGLRTQMKLKKRKFRRLIYGISYTPKTV